MGSWRLLRIDRNVERPECKSAEATGKGAEQSTFRGETSVDGLLCYPGSRSDFVHLRSSEALFKENIRGLFEDSLIHERRIFQGWAPRSFLGSLRHSRHSCFHASMLSYNGFGWIRVAIQPFITRRGAYNSGCFTPSAGNQTRRQSESSGRQAISGASLIDRRSSRSLVLATAWTHATGASCRARTYLAVRFSTIGRVCAPRTLDRVRKLHHAEAWSKTSLLASFCRALSSHRADLESRGGELCVDAGWYRRLEGQRSSAARSAGRV